MNSSENSTKTISCTIGVRLPVQERIELETFCREKDITLSQLVRLAIREFMKRHKEDFSIIL